MKNIAFKITADTSDLIRAKKSLEGITEEEKDIVKGFQEINKESDKAGKAIKENADDAGKSMKNLGGVSSSVGGAIAGAFSVAAILAFGKEVIGVTSEFQKMEAVLKNTLGGSGPAKQAMSLIKDFAATTNFSVAELTQGFVKLANMGFVPTRDELRKLADVANSTGKTFDQLTEALIDAQTGEFERLKEFGIRASKEGDKVAFTFKGVKTQVDFTNDAIRNYVLGLGDLEGVSGSTAAISETLGGKISNLGDAFDGFFLAVGSGSSGPLSFAIEKLTELVQVMTRLSTATSVLADQEAATEAGKIVEGLKNLTSDQILTKIDELTAKNLELKETFTKDQEAIVSLNESGNVLTKMFDGSSKTAELLEKELKELSQEVSVNEKVIDLLTASLKKLGVEAETKTVGLIKKLQDELKGLKAQQLDATSEEVITRINMKIVKTEEELKRLLALRDRVFAQKADEVDIQGLRERNLTLEEITKDQGKKFEDIEKDIQAKITKIQKDGEDERLKYQRQKAEEAREIRAAAFNFASTLVNGLADLQFQKGEEEIQKLQSDKQRELSLVGDNKQAQAVINKKFADEERKIKRQQAETDKGVAIFNILLGTAQNLIKVFPNPILMGLAAAIGAAQVGFVAARPIPKFNKGTKGVPGVDTGDDSVLAMVRPGEKIFTTETSKEYGPILDSIFDKKLPSSELNKLALNYSMPERAGGRTDAKLLGELQGMRKDIKNLKQVNVNIDKKGFRNWMSSGDSETEYLNNYVKM